MPNCVRCEADPQPSEFGSPRGCAFKSDSFGKNPAEIFFTEDNWNCATITALVEAYDENHKLALYGNDESMDMVPGTTTYEHDDGSEGHSEMAGWIILTRYKRRGRVSSAIYVGDFFPPKSVTLKLVERTILYWQDRGNRERR